MRFLCCLLASMLYLPVMALAVLLVSPKTVSMIYTDFYGVHGVALLAIELFCFSLISYLLFDFFTPSERRHPSHGA